MSATSWILMLDWPARVPELRRRVLLELKSCGAQVVAPGVFRIPSTTERSLDRLRPLLDRVRAAHGRALLARAREG